SACRSSSRVSTSQISGASGCSRRARCTAAAMLPAAAMWFSLSMMASYRPMRWLRPPPARTAYFCARRRPGKVLRVSRMAAPVPSIWATQAAVAVAVADRVCRKLSAQRSALTSDRASPCRRHSGWSATTACPSSTSQSILTSASICWKQASNQGRPAMMACSRQMTRASTRVSAGNRSALRSPPPMSSANAAATQASTALRGGGARSPARRSVTTGPGVVAAVGRRAVFGLRMGIGGRVRQAALQFRDHGAQRAAQQAGGFQHLRQAFLEIFDEVDRAALADLQTCPVDEQAAAADRADPRQLGALDFTVLAGEFDPGAGAEVANALQRGRVDVVGQRLVFQLNLGAG